MNSNPGKYAVRQPRKPPEAAAADKWVLRLYVAGQTPRGQQAVYNLRKLCDQYLTGKYIIEIIDLLVNPKLARDDQVVATPTVVRRLPPPVRRVIGDLSNTECVLVGLELRGHVQMQ